VYGSHTNGWGNVGSPVYANISTGHAGGLLKTSLIPHTDLSARITAYFYNVKYQDAYVPVVLPASLPETQAWGRPTFTAELNADVRPFNNLLLSLNYLFVGGRKAIKNVYNSESWEITNMKSINELNFKGEYKFIDWLSVNVRLNNVLFQKYELQYGYPLQGFNVLGGVSIRF
jgi:outer membrane cobalamin receptor